MKIGQQLLHHIKKFFTLLRTKKQSDNECESEREQSLCQNEKKSRPLISTEARRTASNALYFALKTLSSISNDVPVAGALSDIIEPLLDITSRIEQSSLNAQGLVQLATRIECLAPIVEQIAEHNPDQGQAIVLGLQTELASMATDLEAASQRGKLNQFFNNTDNASPLRKHNMVFAQMIADFTLVGVHEVLKSLREFERSKSQNPSFEAPPTVMGDITGGVGVAGGQGHAGGEGGEGSGPKLEMDPDKRYQIGDVSGGTGGTGGVGVEVGGKGGTGKGPVIGMRRSRVVAAKPRAQEVTSIM
ncbi:hypothetical protein K438DRAFT_2028483 [Mycena galopus ATCC 62051]|nr:hypothetical protein K438DRAFT_2028483 [Mycena galopus ATCC 62051]